MFDPYLENEIMECLKMSMDTFQKIMQIKQSKQQPLDNKEWEIVSYGVGIPAPILKVKRLSDNSIWSIGDKIEGWGTNYPMITIDTFRIDYYDERMIMAIDKNGYGKSYGSWKKAKPILFTTTDGKTAYDQDTWQVYKVDERLQILQLAACDATPAANPTCKYFADKNKADEYIQNNKRCLSINDVKSCTIYNGEGGGNILYLYIDKLIEIVKEKIK